MLFLYCTAQYTRLFKANYKNCPCFWLFYFKTVWGSSVKSLHTYWHWKGPGWKSRRVCIYYWLHNAFFSCFYQYTRISTKSKVHFTRDIAVKGLKVIDSTRLFRIQKSRMSMPSEASVNHFKQSNILLCFLSHFYRQNCAYKPLL